MDTETDVLTLSLASLPDLEYDMKANKTVIGITVISQTGKRLENPTQSLSQLFPTQGQPATVKKAAIEWS